MSEPAATVMRVRGDGARLAYLGLIAVAGVHALRTDDPARVWVTAAPLVVAAVVVAALPGRLARVPDLAERWPRWLAAGGAALGTWTLAAFALAVAATPASPDGFYRVKLQVVTPLGDHNAAASLLLAGIAAAAVVAARRSRRWPAWAVLALSGLGLAASLSRGAALTLLGVAAVAAVARQRHVAALLAATGAGALALILTAAALLGAAPPGATGGTAAPSSLEVRVDLWQRAVETFAANPLLGTGLGGFGATTTDLAEPWPHAHNLILHLLAETGLAGAVAYLSLWGVLAWRVRRMAAGRARTTLALAGLALFAHAQLDLVALTWPFELVLAALLALSAFHGPGDIRRGAVSSLP